MSSVNQLVATLQTTRQSLDRSLLRLTALELDDYVTLADITGIFSSFEIMQQAKTELKDCIVKLGNQGKLVQMQLEQLAGSSMDTEYDLMIRDYASDSSEANAEKIRAELSRMTPKDLSDPQHVAAVLGYDDLDEDSVMTPAGPAHAFARVRRARRRGREDRRRVRLAAGAHGRHQRGSGAPGRLWR